MACRGQFWYLWTTTLINRIGSFVLILLALYLTQERGFTRAYAGLVIGLWGAGGAVGTLIGGVLADRWGRKPTMLTALYGGAALMLVLGFARGQLELVTVAVFAARHGQRGGPAGHARADDRHRARAGPAAGVLAELLGDQPRLRRSPRSWPASSPGVDFRLLFVIDAATTVAAATLIVFTIPSRAGTPAAVAGGFGRARVRSAHGASATGSSWPSSA